MNSSFQPSENTFDDVEGHSVKGHLVGDENDTEGHGTLRGGIEAPLADDVEAHSIRGHVVADENDTQAHSFRGSVSEEEEDDVEGHGASASRLDRGNIGGRA